MERVGFKRNLKPLEVLSQDEISDIKNGIEHVLINTGITFEDDEARKLFEERGCAVDHVTKRVRFTENIIHEAIEKTPTAFEVSARDPENSWVIGQEGYSYFQTANGMNSVDITTWQPKEPSRKEFYEYMKVLDYLPNVHGIQSYPNFGFAKVPQAMKLIEVVAAKIRMTSKVSSEGSVLGNDRWTVAMAKLVGMDLVQQTNPTAPLTMTKESTDKIQKFARQDLAFAVTSGALGGAAAPATIAGTLTSGSAEHLAEVIYVQMVKPGTRLFSNNAFMLQNMKTGAPYFAQIGNMLIDAAHSQLWASYGIPTMTVSPSWTNSKKFDFQAAYETALPAMLAALSGATVLRYQGGGAQQLISHPLKAIMDDDVAGMIIRFMQGIEVDEETIAANIINQVGPLPGNFLTTSHTRKWWKKEQYAPEVADTTSIAGWLKSGQKSILENAQDKYQYIIENHQPTPLTTQQEATIEDILNDARNYYKDAGLISQDEWDIYQEDLNSPNYPYA